MSYTSQYDANEPRFCGLYIVVRCSRGSISGLEIAGGRSRALLTRFFYERGGDRYLPAPLRKGGVDHRAVGEVCAPTLSMNGEGGESPSRVRLVGEVRFSRL